LTEQLLTIPGSWDDPLSKEVQINSGFPHVSLRGFPACPAAHTTPSIIACRQRALCAPTHLDLSNPPYYYCIATSNVSIATH
ncbi:hypothetical protein EV363DRAFT_1160188, partial [Boletus edulis]